VSVVLFDTPNAGSTTQLTFCSNAESVNLVDLIRNSQLGAPDRNGTFSPALSTGTQILNPQDYTAGSYSFKYIVEGNDDCPTDEAIITVTIQAAPLAGEDVNEIVCSSELDNVEGLIARFSSLLEGRDLG